MSFSAKFPPRKTSYPILAIAVALIALEYHFAPAQGQAAVALPPQANPAINETALACDPPVAVTNLAIAPSANGANVVLTWSATGADFYDVWVSQNNFYAAPGASCAATASCDSTTDSTYTHFGDVGVPLTNHAYRVIARNSCNDTAAASNATAEFDYGLNGFTGYGADADGDRLPDAVETNTGVFVSAYSTGTNPAVADTDQDRLPDGDEVLGTVGGLNLPGLGTNPLVKNILLEYDWFDDSLECAAHSHRPTQTAVAEVFQAFASSTVTNPNGSTGIVLIHDRGQGGLFIGGNLIADANGVIAGGINNSEFQNHKIANFSSRRHTYFHYTLLPHRYDTTSSSSGQAELPGDDLIVSLYCYYSDHNVAHTIMHELGHNLLLQHGGNVSTNYKPNYNSVMNYQYQFPGVDNNCTPPGDGLLDYSRGTRISLNETTLNEFNGTCGAPYSWDWNGNSVIQSSVSYDVNSDTALGVLNDYNDWGNVVFSGLSDADGNLPYPQEIITEDPLPTWVIEQTSP